MREVQTEDGSFTSYSEHFDEHYHSVKEGALKESLKKHIEPALSLVSKTDKLQILDICYGLGFNSLATLHYLKDSDIKIEIKSPEFDRKLVQSLSRFPYPKEFEPYKAIINSLSNDGYYEDENYSIDIYFGDARDYLTNLDTRFDIVYQDAFSPKKNPTLWTYEYFQDITRLLKDDGVLTTYSSATPVRMGMFENGLKLYEHSSNEIRKGTIASKRALLSLKPIDMLLKQERNPLAKALYDSEL